MSSFDGQDLFSSGLHEFHAAGLATRHTQHAPAGARGSRVTTSGVTGRTITQRGELRADSPAALAQLTAAIEAKLDGLPHVLVDHLGRTFSHVVMLAFRPAAVTALGPRVQLPYTIEYLQTTP